MSIARVVTRGFGAFGSIYSLPRRGYGAERVVPPSNILRLTSQDTTVRLTTEQKILR